MRSTASLLGLTLIASAIAVSVRIQSDEQSVSQSPGVASPPKILGMVRDDFPRSPDQVFQHPLPSRGGVDAGFTGQPELEELTQTLNLTKTQQAEIHPVMIRRDYHYDPDREYLTLGNSEPRRLGSALSSSQFEDRLFDILDEDQQLDYALDITEKDAWWTAIITRLEADLNKETQPEDHLPSPPQPAPPSRELLRSDAVVPSPRASRLSPPNSY